MSLSGLNKRWDNAGGCNLCGSIWMLQLLSCIKSKPCCAALHVMGRELLTCHAGHWCVNYTTETRTHLCKCQQIPCNILNHAGVTCRLQACLVFHLNVMVLLLCLSLETVWPWWYTESGKYLGFQRLKTTDSVNLLILMTVLS